MDLGATVCTRARPRCGDCPVQTRCVARIGQRVAELPTPRPARVVPLRFAELVLVRAGDSVLVERRPPAGIWGGLSSLPEFASPDEAPPAPPAQVATRVAAWLRTRHGIDGADPPQLHSEVRHAFTHFRLRARIWLVRAGDVGRSPGARLAADPARRWLGLSDVADAALPRPIKTLLLSLDPIVPLR
jgi:A/G-specific adenine glycosylase